ncbi:MAG: outer membrane protein assembly factor BamB [Pseudomonadales bacterium]|nr:outer membrane protein assembly factor BamB [Pseudomonadales bacterium]MCP5333618.1 outer membrane protein assembly factor BamB [Pseudomonadales bacterium]HMU89296.1 outer membrane protein assembly factor BamB [Pseudomonadales bacterium]HMW82206.1 outer membrane protein assembly factor BamB [Pseudomonadales bacterium]HMY96079.1 outer membrane protein assembly factor BamB [Pseudomonadales bacterium]
MNNLARALPLLLLCLLAACSSDSKKKINLPTPLVDVGNEVALDEKWSRSIGKINVTPYNRIQLALDQGTLYAATIDGTVIAVDATTGERRWEVETKARISGGVAAGRDRVLVTTLDGELIALSSNDGSELWRSAIKSELLSVPAITAQAIVVQGVDDRLHGLEPTSGREIWSHTVLTPVLTLRGTASPVGNDQSVIAGFANGKLMAFDAGSGVSQWEAVVAQAKGRSELERMVDVDGTPLLLEHLLFAASHQGRIAAFSAADGKPLWAQEASSFQPLAGDAERIYLVSNDDEVQAFALESGKPLWKQPALQYRKLSPPTHWQQWLVVADSEGYLHLLAASDGHIAGRYRASRDAIGAMMIADGEQLYLLDDGGKLRALGLKAR